MGKGSEKRNKLVYKRSSGASGKLLTESNFEESITETLIENNGFFSAKPQDYDAELCLLPQTVIRFLQVTQPEKWKVYKDVTGGDAEAKVLRRIREVVERNGTLHLFRKGFDESGHHFEMCFFKPTSGMNPDIIKLYEGNVFHVMRQVKFSRETEKSIDMGLFLNGLPIFTAELKNKLTGQQVNHAKVQYRDRDAKEPIFQFGRCFAHFAVDTDLVAMTTHVDGRNTHFLPFNMGNDGGAGNPPRLTGIATAYLWEEIWKRDSVLDLIQRFIQVVDDVDKKGKKTGKKKLIFPRYHQLDSVRKLCAHAKEHGAGHQYLNQHSAGSGKTIEIATLANSLATLHGNDNRPVFNSVIVVSDARVINRMLQRALSQFVPTKGMLENIDKTSRQLKSALLDGKKIIVTTIQKFPYVLEDLSDLPQERFAVIIDEAHSSQAGKQAGVLNEVLSYSQEDEDKDETSETWEDRVAELLKRRGRMKNVSFFAFTATPKPETLQLFGTPDPVTGKKKAFTEYTMRQAIEEGFIVDVLSNYTTYNQYFNLLKKVEEDPRVDKKKAKRLLKQFVADQRKPFERKARIIVDHFIEHVRSECGGKAKAMVVARNRLHAVRYAVAIRKYLEELGDPFKILTAFTDTVLDPETKEEFSEARMNGIPEASTEDYFDTDDYRILIVANKFQTGFDQPKLKAMYVDRKLKGVMAVQTLSRLNRIYPGKQDVFVLDFENDIDTIKKAFQEFYDRIVLARETDPNLLYDIRNDLDAFGIYSEKDIAAFCEVAFSRLKNTRKIQKLHALTDPIVTAHKNLEQDDRRNVKSKMRDYVKLYLFLSQIISFRDARLEQFYAYTSFLVKKLPPEPDELPTEILSDVDLENYKPTTLGSQSIALVRETAEVEPKGYGEGAVANEEELASLSVIIEDLNQQFGTTFSPEDRVVILQLEDKLNRDKVLEQQLAAGSKDAVRLSFEQVAADLLHGMVDSNFRFYKKVIDDADISRELFDRLFDRYFEKKGGVKA